MIESAVSWACSCGRNKVDALINPCRFQSGQRTTDVATSAQLIKFLGTPCTHCIYDALELGRHPTNVRLVPETGTTAT